MSTVRSGGVVSREETYALRRDLISRLQAETRGMPRGERFTTQRAFAEAWRELSGRGELGILAGMLHQEESATTRGIPPILRRLATCPGTGRPPRTATPAQSPRGSVVQDPEDRAEIGSREEQRRHPLPLWIGAQGELFPGGLAIQPS